VRIPLSPRWGCINLPLSFRGLRCGLYSFAASRLETAGIAHSEFAKQESLARSEARVFLVFYGVAEAVCVRTGDVPTGLEYLFHFTRHFRAGLSYPAAARLKLWWCLLQRMRAMRFLTQTLKVAPLQKHL
jgi:hypothetical protein